MEWEQVNSVVPEHPRRHSLPPCAGPPSPSLHVLDRPGKGRQACPDHEDERAPDVEVLGEPLPLRYDAVLRDGVHLLRVRDFGAPADVLLGDQFCAPDTCVYGLGYWVDWTGFLLGVFY